MQTARLQNGNANALFPNHSMSISIDMLAAFAKVAQTHSVSLAAHELGVGKSVVSKRVAQLEAALKATLFSRSTRKVALTPAGELYLEHAQRALAEVRGAEERLRELRAELTGQIRLTAPVSWGQRVLAQRLPEFLQLHPAVDIELLLSDRMLDVARERIDIALRWTSSPAAELSAAVAGQVEWAVVASPDYLDACAGGAPAAPQDLAAHPCMGYWRESSDDTWRFQKDDQQAHVRVASRYHADNPEAVAEAALAGLGLALLPSYVCDDALVSGRLVRVLEGWKPLTKFGTQITAVAAPERLRIARNQALWVWLQRGDFCLPRS
jgi:DNA-binding transcriptional LysR family regulator